MELLLQEITVASANGLCVLAVHASLSLPDICSALEVVDPTKKIGKRYIAWFDKWMTAYKGLGGEAAWNLRNAMIHEGKVKHDSHVKRVVFSAPNGPRIHNIEFQTTPLGGPPSQPVLSFDAQAFVGDMVAAVRQWERATAGSGYIQARKNALMAFYPNGMGALLQVPVLG